MNGFGARPHNELDFEALARGDRVAAEVLVERCRSACDFVFDPAVLAALTALSKTRSAARALGALLAQLKGVGVDVPALKRALIAAGESDKNETDNDEDDSQAVRLLAIAEQYEYFCNEDGTPFALIELPVAGGRTRPEAVRTRAKKTRLFLLHQYALAYGKPPTDTALRGVIEMLEARAVISDEVHPVFIRRARYNGAVYFDRGTPDGSVYEIDKRGWRECARAPRGVRFMRAPGMLPLFEAIHVDPRDGLLKLKEVTRFQTDRDIVLVVGFTLDALGGEGPYSVLVITGEPGSAKSTLARLIGCLVDPRAHSLLSAPKDKRSVYINAFTRSLVAYNNLSFLDKAISDAVCTASEGGSDSGRALYTDDEEASIRAKTPFILVAIDNVVTQGDLADRTLKTALAAIPRGERLTEPQFWKKFEEVGPAILGALFGALCEGLRRYDDLDDSDLPRLATFAKFVTACETAFWPEGTFAAAFEESAATASDDVLAAEPVAEALREFMTDKEEWKGTAAELLFELEAIVRKPEREAEVELALARNEARNEAKNAGGKAFENLRTDEEKAKEKEAARRVAEAIANHREARERAHGILGGKWPRAHNALSARLKKVGPQLRDVGIFIIWPISHGTRRVLTVKNAPKGVRERGERSSSSADRPPANGINGLSEDDGFSGSSSDSEKIVHTQTDSGVSPSDRGGAKSSGESASSPEPNSANGPHTQKWQEGMEADSSVLSTVARGVVDFARRNDLNLTLVDGRLAFDEPLWRKASAQMLKALYSYEPEITAWLSGKPTNRPNGWTYE
jgi:hypothetical protein